jgi:hypothetical protein
MEILLRRLLGVYLAVSAVASVPAAFFYFGVENTAGPWWILPAIPLAQGVVFAVAGYLLTRQPAPAFPAESGVAFPPVESLLKLLGVYFMVEGLSSAVAPGVDMLIFTEHWFTRAGNFSAAAVWLVAGWIMVTRPEVVLKLFSRRSPA